MQQILTYAFLVIYTVTILGIVLVIITDNRNPLKTLPWIIVLVFAPVVGLVFYFFFGQNLSKQRIISRRTRKRITMQLEEALDDGRPDIPDEHLPLARLLAATIHSVPLYGSRITPYTDGKSKMEALLAEIARAKHHIHIQYYIFCDDTTGCRLRDALVAKARQGVEVRILYDDVGCSGVKKSFFEGMRREGIEAFAFLHVKFPLFTSKVNYRNHRKILVVDGEIGFTGGINIAQRYVTGTKLGPWRDTHLKLEGEAVRMLQIVFLTDWYFVSKQQLTDHDKYLPQNTVQEECLVQIATSGPDSDWASIMQAFFSAITRAQQHIYISSPYFTPNEAILTAIKVAALSGIDVRIMIPSRSDSKIVYWASRSYIGELIDANVKVYLYRKGFNHSKLVMIDRQFASVGTANMDIRSFEDNFEVSAIIYDRRIAAELEEQFLEDLSHCRLVTREYWETRPLLHNIYEAVARLFSPLL